MLKTMGWTMISKERVRHMTKLAAYEDGEGKNYKKMTQYFRRDYVALELIKSFITGTIAFILMAGLWGVCNMEALMDSLNAKNIITFGTEIVIKYLVFLVIYMIATYIIYNMRYSAGRKKIKNFYNRLKRVSRLYENESKLK